MKRCRVFIAGEGPSDIGDLSKHPRDRGVREGFLQPVLRKLAGTDVRLEFDGRKLATFPKARLSRAADALQHKADQAYRAAVETNSHLLVFVTDVDKESATKRTATEAHKRMRSMRASIEAGFADARRVEDVLVSVSATPCRMIEAWALGDLAAIQELVEEPLRKAECAPQEELWGDEADPESRHPKCVLRRLLGGAIELAELGELADVDAIAMSCPASFAPFADEVRETIANLPE
ncbi:MAG TPA: hypothetical protein VGM88_30380 [Kofleriaceae bacterium]|jgi:hypothetical protein